MSYMSLPRIVFSGRFQADVSTVNNDVRHYSNKDFEPRFQDFQTSPIEDGWWNPAGTGAFRLIDVRVNRAFLSPQPEPADKVVGVAVNAQPSRASAVLVDLDPQFQMGSTLFGLRLQLTDGKDVFLTGNYRSTAFRDIMFPEGFAPSAKFTSVLTDIAWGAAAAGSPVLAALRAEAEANEDTLAVNLLTYGFSTRRPFLGFVSGSIGPWRTGQPKSFVAGRRFAPKNGNSSGGINFIDADIENGRLSLDFGNVLPLVAGGGMANIGQIFAAVLRTPDGRTSQGLVPGIDEDALIDPAAALVLGEVPYTNAGWLAATAGIVDFPLDAPAAALAADHPLALVGPAPAGQLRVLVRETVEGLSCRAEDFITRLDAPAAGTIDWQLNVFARRFGQPIAGLPMGLQPYPRMSGGGIGQEGAPNQPVAAVPEVNFPTDCVTTTALQTSNAAGLFPITFRVKNPGTPRVYLDGQLFRFAYGINVAGASRSNGLDVIMLHVRDAVTVPPAPDWTKDVAPFMQQYDNLYPVMGKRLFSLADPAVAEQHARLLSFAFTRPMDDPNHMPVTRDLSAGKRTIVLKWLSQFIPGEAPADELSPLGAPSPPTELGPPPLPYALPLPPLPQIDAALAALGDGIDGKTQAIREFLQSQRAQAVARGQQP